MHLSMRADMHLAEGIQAQGTMHRQAGNGKKQDMRASTGGDCLVMVDGGKASQEAGKASSCQIRCFCMAVVRSRPS